MKVALLNIRFEISDKSEIKSSIDYTAKGFSVPREQCDVKQSYASVVTEDSVPPTPLPPGGDNHTDNIKVPEQPREISIDDYRGCRKLADIDIETYHSDDYDIEAINKSLCEISMSTIDQQGAGISTDTESKDSGRHSSERQVDVADVDLPLISSKPRGSVSKGSEPRGGVRPKSQSPTPRNAPLTLHFYSGNPSVEKLKGILHIYKDNHLTSLSDDVERSELICMLAVPAKYTIHDLLKFNGPCLQGIEYMRIIRDGSPNQYMVLVKFKTQKLADEYYLSYNNTVYNSIESDVCHLVYVGRVEMLKESEEACFPVPGMTELPNCPVCLERMDESVDGILTILCNHAFHMECLDKWGDTSCPVCRFCQTPEEVADNRCMTCGSQESLWICLVCGNIGCGRYVGLHAYRHFQETQHTYAMELGNNKVWDYVGDNYVHRLVQNKSDGKLVQVDESGQPVQNDKLDALNLEYTYLLTNQLESQRLYFQEKIEDVETAVLSKMHMLEEENCHLNEQCQKFQTSMENMAKEKQLADKKCAMLHTRLKKALHDLQEEQEMNKCMKDNSATWQKRVSTLETQIGEFQIQKDKEMTELRDQLRDVMFYVEAQQKLHETQGVSQSEIQEGQVIVGAAATSPQTRKSRKKPR